MALAPLLSPRELVRKELAGRSLGYFVRQSWPHLGETGTYIHNWHIDAICDHLEGVTNGYIRRLIINIPPRHMKSLICSTNWTAWAWINKPHLRWLCASHSLSLAIRDNRKCRNLIESAWYQQRWGDLYGFSKDQNAKSRFENSQGGYRLAISVGSSLTGEGGDIIVIDDPHNAQHVDHKQRESTLDWYDGALSTRLNNPETGAIVLIMQRLHDKDLAGHLLEKGGWEHLCLPAEYEGSKYTTFLGFKDPRQTEGELLWPRRVSAANIDELKKTLGSIKYASQFQQRPIPASGGQFKKKYLRYFKIETVGTDTFYTLATESGPRRIAASSLSKFVTVDLAVTKKEESDYTVISLWSVTKDKELLLLDVLRDRLDNPEQVEAITRLYLRERPAYIAIETVAYQLALVQQLRRQGLAIREYKPKGDKVARASTASVLYEAGQVYHLANASWLADCEKELLHFPKSEHDDFVDTVSMAAYYLAASPEPTIRRL